MRDHHDALSAIRRQHGRGAARYLAGEAGVSATTARRWLNGTQQPSGRVEGRIDSITDAADEGWVIADTLAEAQLIDAGHVEVFYNGKSAGFRQVGRITVDAELAAELAAAGELFAVGNQAGAEQALSAALLGAYSASKGDSRGGLAGTLTIGAFRTGLRIN
jgi:hypothetical protein